MGKKLIRLALTITIVAALGLWGCANDSTNTYGSSPPNRETPNTVTMVNISFSPSNLTITRGTTVTWKNNDGVTHTSTSNTDVWDTGNISPGYSNTTSFNNVGTFGFHCSIHPSMTGTIVVH